MTDQSQTPPASPRAKMPQQARRAVTAAYLGTLIEWYDYALYGAAAGLIIGPLFFPDVIRSRDRCSRSRRSPSASSCAHSAASSSRTSATGSGASRP